MGLSANATLSFGQLCGGPTSSLSIFNQVSFMKLQHDFLSLAGTADVGGAIVID